MNHNQMYAGAKLSVVSALCGEESLGETVWPVL